VLQVVVPKDKRGDPGSKQRGIHYSGATLALESKFGAARHFVVTSREGESDSDLYHNIEEMYVGNLHQVKMFKERTTKYNMLEPLSAPIMIDISTADPGARWGGEETKRNLLDHWSQVSLVEVLAFQSDTNEYASDEDMASSDWIKDLLTNSSADELSQQVDEKFEKLEPFEKCGISRLKIQLDEMFCMTNDVVAALQTFIKRFAEEGLSKVQGENVSLVSTQLRAVCERLSEVQQLPLENPTYVLSGLTKCSVPEFTGPFKLMLNQECVTQMATPVSLINYSDATYTRVKDILQLANNSYHSLNTSNAWSMPHGHHASHTSTNRCFNCGSDHMLPDCKKPRDKGQIA